MLSRKFKQTVSGRTGPHGDRTTTRELHGGRTGAKQGPHVGPHGGRARTTRGPHGGHTGVSRGPNMGLTGASRNYTGICLIALQVEAFFDGQACVYLDSKVKR